MSEDSTFVRHCPCDSCGSSDGNALYTDGHTYCHVCNAHKRGDGATPSQAKKADPRLIDNLNFESLGKRKLTEASCRRWSYGQGIHNGRDCQVANYYSTDGSQIVAQKVRYAGKEFCILGDASKMGLYGMHLWRDGGKSVVVTEGEIDAITVSQVWEHKWPVVSLPNGAQAAVKAIAKNSEWLEKFETVVLMFDMDEPGQKAAKEAAELLTPGKVKIASLPLKDASELLQADRGAEIVKAYWDAKVFRPDGIVNGVDLWDRIIAEPQPGDALPFPFVGLQQKTLGMRRGELITFAAGSGVGKSEVVRQIYTYLLLSHGETLGLIHLEEQVKRSGLDMMGLFLKSRLRLSREGFSEEQLREAFAKTVGSGKVFLYDHFGSADSDHLFAKIRYFVRGCGCQTIVLDHISMVVSGIEDGDERRIIDNLMTKLATLAQELNARIIIITHLKKPEGTPHEEGGRVSLDQFRGSGSIKQLSHTAVGLERNQQDDDLKHFTKLRVLKCRETGDTGEAGWLKYDEHTGILSEVAGPDLFKDETQPPPEQTENKDF